MSSRVAVGVLGATGTVGQQFVRLLANHPWFEATWLAGSERSEGKKYADAANWKLATPMPDAAAARVVQPPIPGNGPKLVFSALDANVAGDLEKAFAEAGHIVVSNARNYRMDPLVPLLIPEINPDHLQLLERQKSAYGWKGGIVTNSNCSTMFLAMALAPLRALGLTTCNVVTLQAVSGAGYPGVPSLDILGNVVPFIGGEEEKLEIEPQKILGSLAGDHVEPHPVIVSAHTTRVPVIDGHSEMISVGFAVERRRGRHPRGIRRVHGPAPGTRVAVRARPAARLSGGGEPAAAAPRRRARERHGRLPRSPAPLPGPPAQVRGVGPQHRARRGRRGPAQCRAHAGARPALR